jgi:hypothetical protein
MIADWQDFVALGVAAISASYLAWRGWLVVRRKRAGCGGCNDCPSQSHGNEKALVLLEPPKKMNTA